MNSLLELRRAGQSVWLDDIHRRLITGGEIARLVEEDGLRGITSNPTIFEKAIDAGHDYDEAIRELVSHTPSISAARVYEELTLQDLASAADILRPVYDETLGVDGFVSVEVSPRLASDTAGTIAEVRRLWTALARPNVMVKIPATPAGIPAIESMLAEGVNINITLMFSIDHYEAVSSAYLAALERAECPDAASVASFFVSRVDTKVDRALEAIGSPEALALRNKIGVANSKRVYARFREIFSGPRFAGSRKLGARVQRVLWASTSSKSPAYPDVGYVENLVGADTVNTMPLGTLHAFKDHGHVRANAIEENLGEAQDDLRTLERLGIDLGAVGRELQVEGVASFTASYDKLLASLERKIGAITGKHAA